jgi:uncharacterized protein involved in exopolysaccharide biosynthesis
MKIRQTKILGLALLLGGVALCGVGLWLLLSPAQYAATVKIWDLHSVDDIVAASDPNNKTRLENVYDPYFIQTTFEIIKSPLVLSNVVIHLSQEQKWRDKYRINTPHEMSGSIRKIGRHLQLTHVPYRNQIAIIYIGNNPSEAAEAANAVAENYCDYRQQNRREIVRHGMEVLTIEFQKEEETIQQTRSNIDLLRQQLVGQTNVILAEQYAKEKQGLDTMISLNQLLASKIEAEKLEQTIQSRRVQIIDRAEPPQFPVGPNRTLGAVLFTAGLLSLLAGIFLLKPARQPAV